jgi:exodeoxyribonuclease VII small subunit
MSTMAETQASEPTPVDELSFEQARDELALVVQSLEQGSQPLEESLRLWERGEALAARCEQWLKGARERLERARDQHTPESSQE